MPSDLSQLEMIFSEALLRLPGPERAAYLDQACGLDAELRARVEAILASHARAGDFLPLRAETPMDVQRPLPEGVGSTIGPYRLVELIGEGGFGVVFRAEQATPVRRSVALKVIKLGMDTRQVVARFDAEKQALAMMDHPSIAKVIDAGATESGRPYFVMELVVGEPITKYCDRLNLGIPARLELFVQVCQAIQHAHQKGLIHRDIKPTNVLVGTQDNHAVAKVIDFGIAKATDAHLADKTLFTEFRQLVGTPQYMSPEQADSSLDIDTRSDVYSLGVLLYELLTGTTPFDAKELRSKAYAEIQRIIREVEPPRPSTRLSQNVDAYAAAAAHRHTEPRKLSASVRGELDWIVMKALEKDRGRRYESASALAADVLRHLADEPVAAAAPSQLYRLQKFVRRNKGPVLAAAAICVVLVAGMIGTTIGLIGQARQREIAEQERSKAQSQEREAIEQAAVATAVSAFLTDMLDSADPRKLLGDKVTVLQAITAAVAELDMGKLRAQPAVEAAVRSSIGNTLRSLGRYDKAEPNLRKALELRRSALPSGHPDLTRSVTRLGLLLMERGKYAEAESLFQEALEQRQRSLPPGNADVVQALNNLAAVQFSQGKFADAEARFRQALELVRKNRPQPDEEVATSLNNLAVALRDQGKIAAAEPLFLESLDIYRHTLRAGDLRIAIAMDNVGALYQSQGRLAEAEPLVREALQIRRNALPATHPEIGLSLNNLAMLLYDQHRYAEAEVLERESLAIARETLPAVHSQVASGLSNLAQLLQKQQKLSEAESVSRESLAMQRKLFPATHPDIAMSLNGVAGVLRDQGKLEEAEQLFREALQICRQSLPDAHPGTPQTQQNLAEVLMRQAAYDEAESAYREAISGFGRIFGENHWRVAYARLHLGIVLTKLKRYVEAESILLETERFLAPLDPVKFPRHGICVDALVTLYAQWNESEPGRGYDAKSAFWAGKLPATTQSVHP